MPTKPAAVPELAQLYSKIMDATMAVEFSHLYRAGERLTALTTVVNLCQDAIRGEAQQMRASGASWAAIGARLGISKQAAQQRFSG